MRPTRFMVFCEKRDNNSSRSDAASLRHSVFELPNQDIEPPANPAVQCVRLATPILFDPAVLRSVVKVRQQAIDALGDELWLDASPRYAVDCTVMATVHADGVSASPAEPLTPTVARETNHFERNKAAAISEMMPEVYEDLRRLAETFLRGERTAHTLQRTALVHEAFLRLIGEKNLVWQNRGHFIGMFARVMRQTLTNYAVARHRLKRGGSDPLRLTLEFYDNCKIDVTALDEALQALEALDERQARIVELRFFGGLTVEETAELLEISPATVKRDWTLAKIWLRRELSAN